MATRKFSIGDSVRFLNETGGGVITAIISHDLVMVSVEDDFEFEFHTNQLVLVNAKNTGSAPEVVVKTPKTSAFNYTISGKEGVYIAITKEDETEDPLHHVYIVNNTNFIVLYSFNIIHEKEVIGVNSGIIIPASKHLIHVAHQKEIDEWNGVLVDAVFYKKGFYKPLEPVSKRIDLNLASFTRVKNFKKLSLMDKEAFVFAVYQKEEEKKLEIKKVTQPQKLFRIGEKQNLHKPKKEVNEFTGVTTMEVDLHIEELIEDIRGMSNGEIIQIQLRHFQKKLDEAMAKKMRSVVFIHGIGKGVLKNEIISILKTIDGITYSNGSMAKYGSGATEVFLY